MNKAVHKLSNSISLTISAYLIGLFLVAETIGGILANSLTLLADAGHMLSDFLAILLSLIAHKYESKPADGKRSYGYGRMQIIASFVNGITLILISCMVAVTAIMRLFEPPEVKPTLMLVISVIGIVVNGLTLVILQMSSEKNLNMKGAILHVFSDLFGFIAAFAGAIIINYTNLYIVDPLLSILISLLILRSAVRLVKDSMHILMEGAPDDVQENDIRTSLMKLPGVSAVHHIHMWLLHDSYKIVTLHLLLEKDCDPFKIVKTAQEVLLKEHAIQHATIAVERSGPNLCEQNYDHHHKQLS